MGRNLDPKCKRCRREGEKLFLKGERCLTPKCAIIKRNYPPGVHGQTSGGRKMSEYGKQLREKQKAKSIYGILEKQMRRYHTEAARSGTVTGLRLLQLLEQRLDNVVYRLGFASSRNRARQLISHNHILVNDKRVNIPSFQVKPEMKISVRESSLNNKYFKEAQKLQVNDIPSWLLRQDKTMAGEMKSVPDKNEVEYSIDAQLIVEFYSR